jgi:23S rRNA pseudouridine2605 synthase
MGPAMKEAKTPARQAGAPKDEAEAAAGERIAKVLARAGLCSRREAERWIGDGRVSVNGRRINSPALDVTGDDVILVDNKPLPARERTRLFLFHKPRGLVTTARDPEGRPTVFSALPPGMPRVVAVGRLDINTEGLLLLTNDGGLARVLELPATGWLRRYRVRAYGHVSAGSLEALREGIALDGVLYGAIEATIERQQGDNAWLIVGLREGKNREVKKIMEHLGLSVNRLIRISYGPFQLGGLAEGEVLEIKRKALQHQLGERLAREAGVDFDSDIRQAKPAPEPRQEKPAKAAPHGPRPPGRSSPGRQRGGDAHRRR